MKPRMKQKLDSEQARTLSLQGLIKVKEGTRIIKEDSFRGCQELRKLIIPASVKMIESNAFKNCINLRKIVFEGEIPTYKSDTFLGCNNIWEVECDFPRSLKEEDSVDFSRLVRTLFEVKGRVIIHYPQFDDKEKE